MSKTPKLATPISHQFENKESAIEIIKYSDCLEVRERSLESKWDNQHLFHLDIDITSKWGSETKQYLKKAFKIKTELKIVSLQIAVCCSEPVYEGRMFVLGGETYSRPEMIINAKSNISFLREILRDGVSIAIENNNYYPTSAYEHVTDGDFLSEVIIDNDVNLLFDIAHGMVTAHNKGIEYESYKSSLPLNKLIQLHICRPYIPLEGYAYDAHEWPDNDMLKEAVEMSKKYPHIRYFTIEYYKDKDFLIDSLVRLKNMMI